MLPLTVLLLAPSVCQANAGTPLMLAGVAHLFLGNLLIGAVEGWLAAWWFKAKLWKAVLLLILANYASAWAGFFLLMATEDLFSVDVTNVRMTLTLMAGAAFVLTLLVEWWFFWRALEPCAGRFVRSLRATLTVNLATYALLALGYLTVSNTSLLTKVDIVPAASLAAGRGEALYFINADDGKIKRGDLRGTPPVTVGELVAPSLYQRLYARAADGGWNLYLGVERIGVTFKSEKLVAENFAKNVPPERWESGEKTESPSDSWWNWGDVPRLSAAEHSPWSCFTGFWPRNGIKCRNKTTGEYFRVALETPAIAWLIRNAVQVGDDLVVFQLGRNQICLLNMTEKKLALIVRGRAPLPVEPYDEHENKFPK